MSVDFPGVGYNLTAEFNTMNRIDLVKMIMERQDCSIAVASIMLNNIMFPNFYCTTKRGEASNATLTFDTGDSYRVVTEQVK